MTTLVPELLYSNGKFVEGMAVRVDERTGRIAAVIPVTEIAADATREALPGRALLPGFINAHSHAFQRVIRGRTQWKPVDSTADFWSWRAAMYDAVLRMDADDTEAVSRLCFLEMLEAGITTVAEFHYLHRDASGAEYADPNELALRVVRAAQEVGIRIVLLHVAYARGDIEEPLRVEQRRFATPQLEQYLTSVEALTTQTTATFSVGVAPHSVRAVPREWLAPISAFARSHALPLHMHVSEQTAEVDACVAAYGRRPVELLDEAGVLSNAFTGVHCTHLLADEIEMLARTRAHVCACPTTERDLGDGFLPVLELHSRAVEIALGTDSQTVIAPLEDMRLVEYHERLRQRRRILVTHEEDERAEVAPALLAMGTSAGAAAVGIDAGAIETGLLADLVAVDLEHPALLGWTQDSLAALLALTAPPDVVSDVWVHGSRRISGRQHRAEEAVRNAYRAAVSRLL